ncbi:MAG: hypothetical protein D6781_04455, partial [Verrucomicrobia bacterium]
AEAPFPSPADLPPAAERAARVYLRRPPAIPEPLKGNIFWLSEDGDLAEAARNLFALMRRLDTLGFDRIDFEPVPATGLGLAITDRLRRAAAR